MEGVNEPAVTCEESIGCGDETFGGSDGICPEKGAVGADDAGGSARKSRSSQPMGCFGASVTTLAFAVGLGGPAI